MGIEHPSPHFCNPAWEARPDYLPPQHRPIELVATTPVKEKRVATPILYRPHEVWNEIIETLKFQIVKTEVECKWKFELRAVA